MGWGRTFIRSFQGLFVPTMMEISSPAFTSGALSKGWELGLINCIPKSAGAAAITRLHPIALQNVKKIWVMNILCIRVEQIFQRLTHRKQVGCVRGKQTMHHIWGVRSQCESMSRGALVTFDFSNAFPTLTHQFISAVLQLIFVEDPDGALPFLCRQGCDKGICFHARGRYWTGGPVLPCPIFLLCLLLAVPLGKGTKEPTLHVC